MSGKSRWWALPCGVLIFLGVGLTCAVVLMSLYVMTSSMPVFVSHPTPTPELVVGRTYWIGALIAPWPVTGMDIPWASLMSRPDYGFDDSASAMTGLLRDATPVTLIGIQDDWCYVEGVSEWGNKEEGWMKCLQVLDYQPTPMPTPDRTPQRP